MSQPDVVIFGGGVAGLWLLDELVRRGHQAILFEKDRLGTGQTVAAQGIIHGGLKYSLAGNSDGSALGVRQMPALWRECLAGRSDPDLRGVRLRSEGCHLWHGGGLSSRLGFLAAKLGLEVTPQPLAAAERPPLLARHPGGVAWIDEPVIDPVSLLAVLAGRHHERLLLVDPPKIRPTLEGPGRVSGLWVPHPCDALPGAGLALKPRAVVLAAGAGNAALRRQLGLPSDRMQRRPLHMVMVRGTPQQLPPLCGHHVDGTRTRLTITSDVDSQGRTIWQVGGQIAEDGVSMDRETLLDFAAAELAEVLPALSHEGLECASYRIDRAEAATAGRRRPDDAHVLVEGNTLTAWPTKLALVPVLAERVLGELAGLLGDSASGSVTFEEWPRPGVAPPPWETSAAWTPLTANGRSRRAA